MCGGQGLCGRGDRSSTHGSEARPCAQECPNGAVCELQQTAERSLTRVWGSFSGGLCAPRNRSVCFANANGSGDAYATWEEFDAMQANVPLQACARPPA